MRHVQQFCSVNDSKQLDSQAWTAGHSALFIPASAAQRLGIPGPGELPGIGHRYRGMLAEGKGYRKEEAAIPDSPVSSEFTPAGQWALPFLMMWLQTQLPGRACASGLV